MLPRSARWSEVAEQVGQQVKSCHCPPDKHHKYPRAERTMQGGISRLVCSVCGNHRVTKDT